jgi:hypothetical protein
MLRAVASQSDSPFLNKEANKKVNVNREQEEGSKSEVNIELGIDCRRSN